MPLPLSLTLSAIHLCLLLLCDILHSKHTSDQLQITQFLWMWMKIKEELQSLLPVIAVANPGTKSQTALYGLTYEPLQLESLKLN
jgi:hypothetical protein